MSISNSSDNFWPIRNVSNNQMDYIFGDFEKIIEGVLRSNYEGGSSYQPRCDVSETKNHYLASFDIPGVNKNDIKIELVDNQIIISGERRNEIENVENKINLHHEKFYGKFQRTFKLPTTVNTDKIEAHYENGVLNIAIPKAETTKARTIQIQSGEDNILNKIASSKSEMTNEIRDVKISC